MARFRLGRPFTVASAPKTTRRRRRDGPVYADFRPWLEHGFYDLVCAYCGLPDSGIEIDHYVPVGLAPERTHDPKNLVLACARCNGRGGKSDYHPDHSRRTRLPHDRTGFLVVDVRSENPADLFLIRPDGVIEPRGASDHFDRACWNLAVLKLDRFNRSQRRKELIDLGRACELLQQRLRHDPEVRPILDRLMPALARSLRFFEMYEHSAFTEGEEPGSKAPSRP